MNLNPLPEKVIEATDSILLSDLLKSPSFRHFVLSALGNGVKLRDGSTNLTDEDDSFLRFKVDEIVRSIPEDDRKDYFFESGRLIREHKENKREHHSPSVSPMKGLPVHFK